MKVSAILFQRFWIIPKYYSVQPIHSKKIDICRFCQEIINFFLRVFCNLDFDLGCPSWFTKFVDVFFSKIGYKYLNWLQNRKQTKSLDILIEYKSSAHVLKLPISLTDWGYRHDLVSLTTNLIIEFLMHSNNWHGGWCCFDAQGWAHPYLLTFL